MKISDKKSTEGWRKDQKGLEKRKDKSIEKI